MESFRATIVFLCGLFLLAGCTPYSQMAAIDRAEALGFEIDPLKLPPLPPLGAPPSDYDKAYRDRFVEQWMARSDILCRQYKDRIMMVSRDTRLATHTTQTVLSGLATIFSSLSVVHPLTGAATIVGGVGAAADSDVFQKQSGEILASAIQSARANQANQIEKNLLETIDKYNIYRAQRDVAEYHNMCSLETGLSQIRLALKSSLPDAGASPPAAQGTQSNAIQAAISGEASKRAAEGAAAGVAAAQAKGLSPAVGAALGATAGASAPSGATSAAERGAAAVANVTAAGPPPAPTRTRVTPITSAKSKIYLSLGLDSTGKGVPDPKRQVFVSPCLEAIGLKPAPTFPSFMNRPEFAPKHEALANCINTRAAGGQ